MNCTFCKIIRRELPASFVYEDDKVAAFLDLHPINEGHVLVIPKRHESKFTKLTEEETAHLFRTGKKILRAIEESGVKCEGANLFLSDGPVAGQEVMHSHLHIAPRFKGDGQRVGFSHADPDQFPRTRLDQIAAKIADLISQPATIRQPRLETSRLILEPYRDSDLPDIFNYASHPDVARFVPWEAHKSIEDSQKFLDYVAQATNTILGRLFFVFAVRLKDSQKAIGSIDFKNITPYCGQIDYALGRAYWGQGITSEAAEAIRDWAFASLPDMIRFQANCAAENKGSARVMEKIGMTREGLRRKAFVLKGVPVDVVDYALMRE